MKHMHSKCMGSMLDLQQQTGAAVGLHVCNKAKIRAKNLFQRFQCTWPLSLMFSPTSPSQPPCPFCGVLGRTKGCLNILSCISRSTYVHMFISGPWAFLSVWSLIAKLNVLTPGYGPLACTSRLVLILYCSSSNAWGQELVQNCIP